MASQLLVLGGSGFVGRAVVYEGLTRGWDVTTFNRGTKSAVDRRVTALTGDRMRPETLGALSTRDWDLVIDTWSGAPRAARDGATVLAPRTRRYVYISSESVYAPPPPIGDDESGPTVAASPAAEDGNYAQLKRGAELAIVEAFGDRALVARPGLILGPHEDVGRLPWWLNRIVAGRRGRGAAVSERHVLAPGPPDLPLQYVDARDLARFVLDASLAGRHGAFNVVSRRGHATMATLLEACHSVTGASGVTFCWLEPEAVLAAGIEPWTELPIWIPPEHEFAGMHAANVERAHRAGLHCRPLRDTVADTWAWLSTLDGPPPLRPDLEPPGLARDREQAALAAE